MNQYVNEEVNWQRLQDIQREIEFSRFVATNGVPAVLHAARLLAGRVSVLAGMAAGLFPRRRPVTFELGVVDDDQDIASIA